MSGKSTDSCSDVLYKECVCGMRKACCFDEHAQYVNSRHIDVGCRVPQTTGMKTSLGLLTLTIASAIICAEALPACNEETVQLPTEKIVFAIIGGKPTRGQRNLPVECSTSQAFKRVVSTLA